MGILLTDSASMLRENPQLRPNIYQVLKEACAMRGKEVPIKDVKRLILSEIYNLTRDRFMATGLCSQSTSRFQCPRRPRA